jgi:hypothetical protein
MFFRRAKILSMLILSLSGTRTEAAPAADLWAFWQPAPTADAESISHDLWQQLLDHYLSTGDDQINRFDYQAVSSDDRKRLTTYLQTMTSLDPRTYPIDEQMAYWINLYNALTIQVVLTYPNKDSILRMGRGLFSFGPWNDELVTIVDVPITLNDIEHRILRPIWRDHRIHFAVNCASLGCPNLSAEVFTAAKLDSMLAAAESAYLNHPRGVSFNDQGELVLSSIFDWYREDFAANREMLLAYLAQRHASLAPQLSAYTGPIRYRYDWSLNQVSD